MVKVQAKAFKDSIKDVIQKTGDLTHADIKEKLDN